MSTGQNYQNHFSRTEIFVCQGRLIELLKYRFCFEKNKNYQMRQAFRKPSFLWNSSQYRPQSVLVQGKSLCTEKGVPHKKCQQKLSSHSVVQAYQQEAEKSILIPH
jgi:hypothetical protein